MYYLKLYCVKNESLTFLAMKLTSSYNYFKLYFKKNETLSKLDFIYR